MLLTAGVALGAVVTIVPATSSDSRIRSQAPAPPAAAAAAAISKLAVEIAATGDVTLGRAGEYPPGGPGELLGGMKRMLRAPITLGNLETTLVDADGRTALASKCGAASTDCFAFGAPRDFARGLRRTGFTAFNLANNHTNDYGPDGRASTVGALAGAGLRSTGGPAEITVVRAGRMRVALLGFAPYWWSSNLLDLDGAQRLVRLAGRRADIVVVAMHVGAEGAGQTHVAHGPESYLGEARGDSRAFSRAVVDAGADLVLGSGPHVLRGMEWYRGRLIAYSLGNFSGYHTLSVTGDLAYTAILRVKLDGRGRFLRGRLIPLVLREPGSPAADPSGSSVDLVRTRSSDDFGRTAVRLDESGRIKAPLGARIPRAAGRRGLQRR